MYEVLLFDLDGTLTDSKHGITRSVQYALAKYNIYVENLEELHKFIGPPLAESFKIHYGFDREQAWQAVLYFREYFSPKGMYENQVYPGIPQLLASLHDQGRKMVVATSKATFYSKIIIKHFGLDSFFSHVVGSNMDGTRSSKAEIIADIIALFPSLERDSFLMIGDKEHDIIGAKKNGIDSLAVAYGYGSPEELREAGPTYTAATVGDLRDFFAKQ